MLFNSVEFGVFALVVFVLYWLLLDGRLRLQNLLLLVASYVFYGWWDWRFLSLILASSLVDFLVGRQLAREDRAAHRRWLLCASLTVNLGMLGFFKYYNFFADSLAEAAAGLGISLGSVTLDIVLPVGISFYTFQTLSYTVDVFRRRMEPTTDALSFFAFVAFFPQLVAGPIERASSLLPQFQADRTFSYQQALAGLRQILWGLFKKVVIADTCGSAVDVIFAGHESMSSLHLAVGLVCFAFQIYADFSGYSDVAIGVARLFGFELMTNFRFPYFSRDLAEFWRRWHISLSTWFRDYVYIPLGGSRSSKPRVAFNVVAVFVVSGLWHGANWTFVVWGLIHGLLVSPMILRSRSNRDWRSISDGRLLPSLSDAVRIAATFLATSVAWVFFRSPSVSDAWSYLARMVVGVGGLELSVGGLPLTMVFGLVVAEWLSRNKAHPLADLSWRRPARWGLYLTMALAILGFGVDNREPFIYFQF